MNNLSHSPNRRTFILIVVLVLIPIGIVVYLGARPRPSTPPPTAEPTPYQPRPASVRTVVPGGGASTPAPTPAEAEVGPLVPATDHTAPARTFDEEQALEHLAFLAADEQRGRQPGTPGGQAAGEYIAARFAEYGLEPAGLDSTYFQTFTVPYGRITEPPALTVVPPGGEVLDRTYAYRTDYRALTGGYLGAGEGEGPVIWLNECLHDDYAGIDAAGKIVLCRYSRNPEVYRQAIEHQVGGLLLLDREQEGGVFRPGGYRETAWVPETVPAYLISEAVARDLLTGTRYTLDDLSLRFAATPLSTTVALAVTLEEREAVEARNVLALLPGSDPLRGDELVVIGAHYDHLGQEPDGAIMHGANDNASGVATVLEIARLWQAQDFFPARSVLFAAWDGEEQGLLGSRYYVQHPTYPLTRTVAVLNLDMVGTGEALRIDGEGAVATQLRASAEVFGITTTLTFDGRSDHVSFHAAGIPAATSIWWPDTVYHTPDDQVQAIEPEKLKAVGVLSAHALAALAQGHVELERAVERLRASIATGDRELFLEGLDPANPGLRAAQAAWFDSLWWRELTRVTIEPSRVRVGDGEADVTLTLAYRWADVTQHVPSVSYDVRFVQRDGAWTFAGHELDALSGDVVTVARFPGVPVEASQLLSTTQAAYVSVAADLGLEPITGTRFIFYPDAATMRAIARPAADRATRWLVPSAGLAELAWGQPITPALVNLALNQMGLPPGAAPWLREGLALHHEDGTERERELLPALVSADVRASLLGFPALEDAPDTQVQALRAQAWSATQYLLDRYGTAGLRAPRALRTLCAAWGQSGDAGTAFRQALGLSLAQFEAAWHADRLDPLRADGEAIQAALAARAEAVLRGDVIGFLATVTPADAVLRAEERNWFADLASHPVLSYTATGRIVSWSPGGAEAVVAVSARSVISGEQPAHAAYDARFVRAGDRWLYTGVAWSERASEHFVLKYQDHDDAWAERVLHLAEAAYDPVTGDLDASPPLPVEVKVYDQDDLFRTSVSLALPVRVTSWTGPGEAIKLRLQDGSDHAIQRAIARELAHQVLFAQGLQSAWLHEGMASYEAGRATPLGTHRAAGEYLPMVQEALRRHQDLPPTDGSSFEGLPEEQMELATAHAWSMVSFVADRHGLAGLRRLIAQTIAARDVATALRATLGMDLAQFQADWETYVLAAGVPDDLASMAQQFDPQRALADIAVLSGPAYGGREAGTPGAERAAATIAGRFAALGLEPLGDPLTDTGTSTLSYLQQFPISHTHLVTAPALMILDADGAPLHEFTYRADFIESAGEGIAEGELVWVQAGDLEGLRFGGAIVLERDVRDPAARAAQLQARGAGGLIVVTSREADDFQTSYVRPAFGAEAGIPVFELTEAAFETLLKRIGMESRHPAGAPPALPLGVRVRQALVRSPVTTTLTANVVGLLPGRDPQLADEVLIVGAHYDHIGASPDGLYFPGANQNGSGVAALLEMARVWKSAGYRPARSVLFAAWGAEEVEGAGVAHYLAHPAVPLTQTVGVIALDSIGGGRGYKLLFFGTPEHDLPLIHRLAASATELDRRAWRRGSTGVGWHTAFNGAGIPTVKMIWAEAEQDAYLPTDTADRIDLEHLASSGEVVTMAAAWLARR